MYNTLLNLINKPRTIQRPTSDATSHWRSQGGIGEHVPRPQPQSYQVMKLPKSEEKIFVSGWAVEVLSGQLNQHIAGEVEISVIYT